ncbi:DUF1573 domain-containing protein [Aquimarina sp. AU474]|uniref:DUF1573 domain-containing protein n=1 Tax=Aquimarina sp. AU474 TaxID=2108529 RepID=UPI000D69FEF0|nr:DUF1573 domain-containing protein [Aquimarina sp. AU474]
MKKVILIASAILTIGLVSCTTNASSKVNPENVVTASIRDAKTTLKPVMTFNKVNHDFGTINEGETVAHTFTFTNTGKAPLVIINAVGSCGCTVSKWPRKPIAPGATGDMLVTFNSNGKPNLQSKQVTITANTEKGKEILKIKAMVTPKTKIKTNGSPASK